MKFTPILNVDDLVIVTNTELNTYDCKGIITFIRPDKKYVISVLDGDAKDSTTILSREDIDLYARKGTKTYDRVVHGQKGTSHAKKNQPPKQTREYKKREEKKSLDKLFKQDETNLNVSDYHDMINMAIDIGDFDLAQRWVDDLNKIQGGARK